MKRYAPEILVAALVVGAAAAAAGAVLAGIGGPAEPKVVPRVVGQRLDVAVANMDAHGLSHRTVGGGTFGVVVRSHWQVCSQVPRPGMKAAEVKLIVERACPSVPPVHAGVVPDIEYESLDEAEAELRSAGLGYEVNADDEILVRSNWQVCDQDPAPGEWARSVELYVDKDCDDWDW